MRSGAIEGQGVPDVEVEGVGVVDRRVERLGVAVRSSSRTRRCDQEQ
jgi:hypothetical protein